MVKSGDNLASLEWENLSSVLIRGLWELSVLGGAQSYLTYCEKRILVLVLLQQCTQAMRRLEAQGKLCIPSVNLEVCGTAVRTSCELSQEICEGLSKTFGHKQALELDF